MVLFVNQVADSLVAHYLSEWINLYGKQAATAGPLFAVCCTGSLLGSC
jgi:hypothetical protein